MPTSPRKALRIKPGLLKKIETAQGKKTFSAFTTRALEAYLEGNQGLGEDFRDTLLDTNRQLIALGRNLNQLTHAANEGRPVTIDNVLIKNLRHEIIRARDVMTTLRTKLP